MTIEIHKIPFNNIEKCGVSLKDKDNSYSLKKHALENEWDIAINGAMFSNGKKGVDPFYYWNITDMVTDGILNRGGNYSDKGIAFGNPFAGVSAYWSKTSNCVGKPVDFIGGAPTLIIDGKINMDMKGLGSSFATNFTQRTAIGIDGSNIYLATTRSTKATLKQVAQALLDKGCLNAINFDGGGSTAFYEKKPDGTIDYFTQNRNVTSSFGIKFKQVKKKIILDPGHSPLVKGKESLDGSYKEYEFNLDIANRMLKLLKPYCEALIVDYSDFSPSVELGVLISKINRENANLCVSLHSNASENVTANGWEIFTYKMEGESLKAAQSIQKEIKPLGFLDRGIKDGSHLAVIRETTMPTVLIETGFHTNKQDLAKLKDTAFRDKVASAYTKGVLNYFGIEWVEPSVGKIYRVQVGSFINKESAIALQNNLKLKGFDSFIKED